MRNNAKISDKLRIHGTINLGSGFLPRELGLLARPRKIFLALRNNSVCHKFHPATNCHSLFAVRSSATMRKRRSQSVQGADMKFAETVSRRSFLIGSSCFGTAFAWSGLIPAPALTESLAQDARVAAKPLVDKGFALVRKIGEGAYATISDPSKGVQTLCNGGFVYGKETALVIEGFASPAGAAMQMEALRMVTQVPIRAAVDTHYHFDHSLGNSFYGARSIPIWAHAKVASRIAENYIPMQGMDRAAVLEPFQKRVREAKNETQRQHAQGDVAAMTSVFVLVNSTVLSVPNQPLDPAKLPFSVDLGGLTAVFESYPGHSGTDMIVRLPDQKIVFTGDLLFHARYPVAFDEKATISGWRATLAKFASYDKDTIFVPGHGQICGQEGVAFFRSVFDDIAGQAEKMYKAGVPVEEAMERYVVPEKFKDWPIFAWGFTIGPAIAKLYDEWKTGKS
jgi:glyoxylase-like metal-dependent hydrolase (beta-lactamase superfamily II)